MISEPLTKAQRVKTTTFIVEVQMEELYKQLVTDNDLPVMTRATLIEEFLVDGVTAEYEKCGIDADAISEFGVEVKEVDPD